MFVELNLSRLKIWLLGVSFVLLQFFLQLSSGIVINAIMNEMHLKAFTAGLLSSAFFIVYTCLQIPVGILFDCRNTRSLLTISVLIMSVGCFIFAHSFALFGLFIGRFLMGLGASFAFVGLSHLLRQHYPRKQFAFMLGFSETLAFLITVIIMLNMSSLLDSLGWRGFINTTCILSGIIALLCWNNIPNSTQKKSFNNFLSYKTQLTKIIYNKQAWINGLFAGLGFSVITVFAALWSIPFLQIKLHCSLAQASFQTGLLFLGAAVSCPLFGLLAIILRKRRNVILSSCFFTAILLICMIYLPIYDLRVIGLLMFLVGLCCGAYMLAYTIANEIAPSGGLSTCAGFTNTLAVLTAPILQPIIGFILDLNAKNNVNIVESYQTALLIIPILLIVAGFLVFYLPEKNEDIFILDALEGAN